MSSQEEGRGATYNPLGSMGTVPGPRMLLGAHGNVLGPFKIKEKTKGPLGSSVG